MLDWSSCTAVERDPKRVSGEWVFRGTRVPVSALFENLGDFSFDLIASTAAGLLPVPDLPLRNSQPLARGAVLHMPPPVASWLGSITWSGMHGAFVVTCKVLLQFLNIHVSFEIK